MGDCTYNHTLRIPSTKKFAIKTIHHPTQRIAHKRRITSQMWMQQTALAREPLSPPTHIKYGKNIHNPDPRSNVFCCNKNNSTYSTSFFIRFPSPPLRLRTPIPSQAFPSISGRPLALASLRVFGNFLASPCSTWCRLPFRGFFVRFKTFTRCVKDHAPQKHPCGIHTQSYSHHNSGHTLGDADWFTPVRHPHAVIQPPQQRSHAG